MAIDDGRVPMTEDSVGASEQKMAKKEILDDDRALSGGCENQTESTSQLDERRDEDDDVANRGAAENENEMMEELDREEMEELDREMEELYWEMEERYGEMEERYGEMGELMDRVEEEAIKWSENQKKEGKQRGKSQKQGRSKLEAALLALGYEVEGVPLIGKKVTKDHQVVKKKKKAKDFNTSHLLDAEDERMDESDKETGVKLLDGPVKECWEDSSDDESTLSESLNKVEIDPEEPKLEKSRSPKKKNDSEKLRSPVICVLGHVDTGKTKLLDFIRKTHVQDEEAGGITQQIGSTMITQEALRDKCKMANDFSSFDLKLPGLLVIDTPGHESFRNLRCRGASICDMAILVVDIMHGLEPQTIESINLLRDSKTCFVVALNKVDRLFGWKGSKDSDVESTVKSQGPATQEEFKKRCQEVIAQFANQCLNAALFYENADPQKFVSMVPTSAISGDGMGNLMSLIARLTQTHMPKKLTFSEELEATVFEVKAMPGLGMTLDVILVNGRLKAGDTIVMGGRKGPVVGKIRSLLTPHPLKEMRVKNEYVEHKSIEGTQGVKITGKALEKALAGLPLFVARKTEDEEPLKEKVAALIEQVVSGFKTSELGVYVQASTLGSLEAFLEYLTSIDIPYFAVKIGPVVKKDVKKASVMLESDVQFATILAFDVKVERGAQEFADSVGVKVIAVDQIYHAGDEFLKHRVNCLKKKEEALSEAVFPCVCEALTSGTKSFEVLVEEGRLRVGTPLLSINFRNLELGVVTSILTAADDSSVDTARAGDKVKIQLKNAKSPVKVCAKNRLISRVSRKSYELCKKYCKKDFSTEEWQLLEHSRMVCNLFR